MQDLSITLIQSALHWRSSLANQQQFEKAFKRINGKTDLVILPEMFTTGFAMHPEGLSESIDGPTTQWLKTQAKRLDAAMMGSFIVQEEGNYFNRLVFIKPDGHMQYYDKKHLFRMAGENKQYQSGDKKLVVNYKGWNILPLICYDLRFPVWSRNRLVKEQFEYDLMVVIANWPKKRSHAWKTLLMARAIENQAFVAGVNRIGSDDNGIAYSGDSMVIDPWGTPISVAPANQQHIKTIAISKKKLDEIRNNFAVSLDWDDFMIKATQRS
ncbi:MAG: amidohydrolase [Bacteroidales bacterium]|nr:amidohydrolase [Bacteroidales bacterium]MDZ4203879.1 amidohydrolase [Bacteroidales bacterium]